jgi:hypothetical protein
LIPKQTLHHPDKFPKEAFAGNQSNGEQKVANCKKHLKTKILHLSGKMALGGK